MADQAAARMRQTFLGGCECGAVVFEVELGLALASSRAHSVWECAVDARSFRVRSGDEHLSGHQFVSDTVSHFYCERCGERVFARHLHPERPAIYAIDLKCLHQRLAPERSPVQLSR